MEEILGLSPFELLVAPFLCLIVPYVLLLLNSNRLARIEERIAAATKSWFLIKAIQTSEP